MVVYVVVSLWCSFVGGMRLWIVVVFLVVMIGMYMWVVFVVLFEVKVLLSWVWLSCVEFVLGSEVLICCLLGRVIVVSSCECLLMFVMSWVSWFLLFIVVMRVVMFCVFWFVLVRVWFLVRVCMSSLRGMRNVRIIVDVVVVISMEIWWWWCG